MKRPLKQLLSLNLALVLLLTLLPVQAQALNGYYAYNYNMFFENNNTAYVTTSRTLGSWFVDEPTQPGWVHSGWSLEPNGVPLTSTSQIPTVTYDTEVNLYGCWARTQDMALPNGETVTIPVGPIRIGDTLAVDYEDLLDLSQSKSGTGWTFADGVLTLTEEYSGTPIYAYAGLILAVEGDVSIAATDGPAIYVNKNLYFKANSSLDSSLTVTGVSGSPAMKLLASEHYAEYPFTLDVEADSSELALDLGGTSYYDYFYYSISNSVFANNQVVTATSSTSGSNLTLYRYINPNGPTLTLTPDDPEQINLSLTLDPNDGTLPGYAADTAQVITRTLSELDMVDYNTLRFPAADVLPSPTRDGHLLLGWSHNSSGTYVSSYLAPGAQIDVTKADTTLYAIWQETPGEQHIFLDGNGEYIQTDDLPRKPRLALPLTDGAVTLPDTDPSGTNFIGWSKTPMEELDFETIDMAEDLLYPGETVSLPHGTILYAVYANHTGAQVHGNGHTTAAGSHAISVPCAYAGNASDSNLLTYHTDLQQQAYFVPNGEAILDLNTKADGSGQSSSLATGKTYVQWTAAPEGSILLYSHNATTAEGRYGKLVPAEEAAAFDLTSASGFTWPGHRFLGWSAPGGQSALLTQLPDPDQNGLILLGSSWEPYTVTYEQSILASSPKSSCANNAGETTIVSGSADKNGYIFNGWNTREDGTGTWYLPGQKVALTGDLTVYEQTLHLAADEPSILVEDPTGTTLYTKLIGTAVADQDSLASVTLPDGADHWILNFSSWNTFYGFSGNKSYQLPKGCRLQLYDDAFRSKATFHGNGGTFTYGSEFRSLIRPSSFSSLTLYPSAGDFVTTPPNATLGGWSEDAVVTETSTIYEPGLEVGYYDKVPNHLYAVWDTDTAAYITFADKDTSASRDESFTRRYTAGSTITLPIVQRTGYKLDGWSDGTTTYPAGSSYTVPTGDTTLTAQWSARTKLMVNGVEYDATIAHDYSNGGTQGWKYDPSNYWKALYLYNYNGGEIYLPDNTDLYVSGTNTVTSTSIDPAISSPKSLDIKADSNSSQANSLTVQGSSDVPALYAYQVTLQNGVEYTISGGSGAPAVDVEYRLYLRSGHAQMSGGTGAPALRYENSYGGLDIDASYAHCYAGETPDRAVQINPGDYNAEACIVTKPVLYTLTLDAGDGKVNGRSILQYQLEYNQRFMLNDLELYHPKNQFLQWTNQEGNSVSYSIYVRQDTTLTAQWLNNPYEQSITLDCQGTATLNGERSCYLELPASGTVTLPTPTVRDEYTSRYTFYNWQGQTSSGSWVEVPAGVPLDVKLFEPGMSLRAGYTQNTQYILYTSLNGVPSYSGESLSRRSNSSSPVLSISRWAGSQNAMGLVVDSWNTKPDGSGTAYQPGDNITIEEGVYNTVLYAQWKPILTHTTTKANEVLPSWTAEIKAYVRNANGKNISSLIAWRNADSTKFYTPGQACDLPAGTTLYAFCGDMMQDANIWLHGNGATEPVTVMPSAVRSEAIDETYSSWNYYSVLNRTGYERPGYKLSGWNTQPDGSGTAYELDHQFYYGLEYQDTDGNWVQDFDSEAMALIPDALYAQWEKLPSAEIPVPLDMLQEENAVIYVAVYNADGSFAGIQTLSGAEKFCALYDTAPGMTYQFLCLADDSTAAPLTLAESGQL